MRVQEVFDASACCLMLRTVTEEKMREPEVDIAHAVAQAVRCWVKVQRATRAKRNMETCDERERERCDELERFWFKNLQGEATGIQQFFAHTVR